MVEDTPDDQAEHPSEDQPERLADVIGADLVPLSVGAIPIVRTPDGPVVALRHAVEALGLDYSTVRRTLRARSWGSVGQLPTLLRDGRRMQMVTVDVRTYIMWIATVNEHRVPAGPVRDQLIATQREAADALYGYAARGIAVNPRDRTPEQVALIEAAAAGLVGPVLGELNRAHYHLQIVEGRRDGDRDAAKRAVPRHLKAAYAAALDAGLPAGPAISGAAGG